MATPRTACIALTLAVLLGCPSGDDDDTTADDDDSAGDDDTGDDDDSADDDDTTADDDDSGDDDTTAGDDDTTGDDDDTTEPTAAGCFDGVFVSAPPIGPDYDQFAPQVAHHCQGTDHQSIVGVEKVVFVGDSVTVGTPPFLPDDYYRSILAEELAVQFGLEPPGLLWKSADVINGTAIIQESGDFACCAKWGARTDDLMQDHSQIEDCIPEDERHKTHLVVMTVGGNDIADITQDGLDGTPVPDNWVQTEAFVQLMRESIEWFFDPPDRFPNGVYVLFANMFEFTDGTGFTEACPLAGLAGYGAEWDDPQALADMVIWANEQYMQIAVETQTDMIFMLEEFCGHGFYHDHPGAPCYRGPGSQLWFDTLTCIHPNTLGHDHIAQMFMNVVVE